MKQLVLLVTLLIAFASVSAQAPKHKIHHRHLRVSKMRDVADKQGRKRITNTDGSYSVLKVMPDKGDTLLFTYLPNGKIIKALKVNFQKKFSTKVLFFSTVADSADISDSVLTNTIVCYPKELNNMLPPNILPISEAAGTAQSPIFIPSMQSLLGSPFVVWLNFGGDTVDSRNWSSGIIYAAAPNLTTAQIIDIFNRVAEKYRPFNINITTDRNVYMAAAASKKVKAVITPTYAWYGVAVGGVAYVGSFGYTVYDPAWIFSSNLANTPEYIADAIAHEVGHTLGLQHHGQYNSLCIKTSSYYSGKGTGQTGWGAIMGAPYGMNEVLWYKGATTTDSCYKADQDDLAIITTYNGFGYRPHQNWRVLQVTNNTFADSGLIIKNTDVDTFKIFAGTGSLTVNAAPYSTNPTYNTAACLDIRMEVYNSSGQRLSIDTPLTVLNCSRVLNITAGTYTILIKSGGNPNYNDYGGTGPNNYGSLGRFYITGSVGTAPPNPCSTPPTPVITGATSFCQGKTSSLSTGSYSTYKWSTGATTQNIIVSTGALYSLTVTDINGCTGSTAVQVTVNQNPVVTISCNPCSITKGNSATLTANGGKTYNWGFTTNNPCTVTPTITTTYTVLGTDGNGCTGSASNTITVTNVTGCSVMPKPPQFHYCQGTACSPSKKDSAIITFISNGADSYNFRYRYLKNRNQYSDWVVITNFKSGQEIPFVQIIAGSNTDAQIQPVCNGRLGDYGYINSGTHFYISPNTKN